MKAANVFVTSELYNAGTTEDGQVFAAERFFVVVENASGARWAHNSYFNGCNVERCPEDGYTMFLDIREEATAKAEKLAQRVRSAGVVDLAHWSEIDPCYASAAYQSAGTEAQRVAEERAAG